MSANVSVLNDNLLYLSAWFEHNEALKKNLQVIGSELIWNHDHIREAVSLQNFYLPTLLYNLKFREDIQNSSMTSEDLFRIIRVHVLAEDVSLKSSEQPDVVITSFMKQHDELGNTFILFQDSLGHRFKMKQRVEEVETIYQKILQEKGIVKFQEFKKELEVRP